MSLAEFDRLPPRADARLVEGLSAEIDAVAARAADTHRFLRYGWFAAAVKAYGGHPRTIVVREDEVAVLTLPLVGLGRPLLRLATVPGSYWPFRSFPLALEASGAAADAALRTLARAYRGLRLGPVEDGDPAAAALIAAARTAGWTVLDRIVGESWVQNLADPDWPRASSLKKNRFHEKHLAEHGALDWRFLSAADWPAAFDLLARVEEASWIADRTDGSDAKFMRVGHGRFWRAAAKDPALAGMFRAALLTVDGGPAAFSFDIDIGRTLYAVANSYDPAFARHSPGKLLHYRNLSDAKTRGVAQVDWGMGDSGYKRVLGAAAGPQLRDWFLLRPGLPAAAGRMLARWFR